MPASPDTPEQEEIARLRREVAELQLRLHAREGEAAMLRVLLDQATGRKRPAKAFCLAATEPRGMA